MLICQHNNKLTLPLTYATLALRLRVLSFMERGNLVFPQLHFLFMHLLYIDESGHADDATQRFFVMIGVSFFEKQTFWVANELDNIAARFDPADPFSIELHGSPMKQGKGIWKSISGNARAEAFKDALTILTKSHKSNRLFGIAIEKAAIYPQDPVQYAFEQLLSRFDHYLMRLHKQGDSQRGIVILDKTSHERTLQNLATAFRTVGHSWGVLRNLSEVPLFLDSKASRLIQLADLVAYATFRYFEKNDSELFNLIEPRFDRDAGTVHGLHIRTL